jgi:hypothetical protein
VDHFLSRLQCWRKHAGGAEDAVLLLIQASCKVPISFNSISRLPQENGVESFAMGHLR